LRQLEIQRPMSDSEFLAIDGVEKAKLEKYGDIFIKAIIEFEKIKKNTIEEIIYKMKETNIKIKEKIGDDTIDLETAKKLEDYGKIFRQLSAVEGYNNKILFGSQEVKNSVEKLYRDIESGNGERVNYEKFVKFETKKVKELHSLLIDLERVQRENIQAFQKVNPEIEKFLSSLSEN